MIGGKIMIVQIFDKEGKLKQIISLPEYEEPSVEAITKAVTENSFDCRIIDCDD